MALPIFQSPDQNFMLMQTKWAAQLNPTLSNPLNSVSILKGVSLVSGNNVINHLLGRTLQGWFVVDTDSSITLYRNAPKNNLTLSLFASSNAIIDLAVF